MIKKNEYYEVNHVQNMLLVIFGLVLSVTVAYGLQSLDKQIVDPFWPFMFFTILLSYVLEPQYLLLLNIFATALGYFLGYIDTNISILMVLPYFANMFVTSFIVNILYRNFVRATILSLIVAIVFGEAAFYSVFYMLREQLLINVQFLDFLENSALNILIGIIIQLIIIPIVIFIIDEYTMINF